MATHSTASANVVVPASGSTSPSMGTNNGSVVGLKVTHSGSGFDLVIENQDGYDVLEGPGTRPPGAPGTPGAPPPPARSPKTACRAPSDGASPGL